MSRAPGPRQWLPLPYGPFGALLRDPLAYHRAARERFGDVVRMQLGPIVLHFLYHPDHVRHVLFENPRNYLRGWQYRLLGNLFGENLVSSEGPSWRRHRRLAQPAFNRNRLAGYAGVMVDANHEFLDRCSEAAASGDAIDVRSEMSRTALAIAGRTLFDRDTGDEADTVGRSFGVVARYLEHRFNHAFTSLPSWVPTPTNIRFKRAVRTLNEVVLAIVRERRTEGRDHGDLLSMLLAARDEETGEGMSDVQLRSESLAFLIAGHETTATALTWTCYLLARHAEYQRRIKDEADRRFGDRDPILDDVDHLPETRRVIEESLRMFPPVWTLPRHVVETDEIGGHEVPRGSTIVLVQAMTHRHPDAWQCPDRFDPDRYARTPVADRPKGAYFPFLGGPHLCIGHEFAMIEMSLLVAMFLRRFRLESTQDEEVEPHCSITLRPKNPVRLRLVPH